MNHFLIVLWCTKLISKDDFSFILSLSSLIVTSGCGAGTSVLVVCSNNECRAIRVVPH